MPEMPPPDVARKIDALVALSSEEQGEFGRAMHDLTKLKGWEMLQALLRSTMTAAAMASLKDRERGREYYEGVVDMVEALQSTIAMSIKYAEAQVEKERDRGASARVLAMLKPGGGGL